MESQRSPLISRPLLVFMGTMILANIASHMYRPLLPLYIQQLGADVGQVGLFFTLSSFAPLAFQILGGWLSDQLGRLQAIAIGSLAGVLSFLVFIVAPTWQWLLISVAATSMSVSFVAPSYQAFVAEQSTEENRGRVYGISESLFTIVGIVGPPIGGWVSEKYGYTMMFIAGGALYTLATLIRLGMARNARRQEGEPRPAPSFANLKDSLIAMSAMLLAGGLLTWVFICDGFRDVAFGMSDQLMPLYMQNQAGLTNVQIGWLSSFSSIATMLLMSPAGWLADKKSERVGIVGGFFLISVAIFVFVRSRGFEGFVLAWLLFGVSNAFIAPAYNSLISKVVPTKLRGTAFGLFSTSLSVISLPAPWIGGQLWQRISPVAPFYVPMVVNFLLLPIMWVKFKIKRSTQSADLAVSSGAE